jgi:plastocyanin
MMLAKNISGYPKQVFGGIILLLFIISNAGFATNYIIKFGGSFGTNYSPSELSVAVGDTITWQGTFSNHPLSSTSVPQGAASFHNGNGTIFSYPVQVPGNYNYECDIHGPSGMTGSFTANVSAVNEKDLLHQPEVFRLNQNFPNPFNPNTIITFELPVTNRVDLSIYNLLGQKVITLVSGIRSNGIHQVEWDASNFSSGVYFYRLVAGEYTQVRQMLFIK